MATIAELLAEKTRQEEEHRQAIKMAVQRGAASTRSGIVSAADLNESVRIMRAKSREENHKQAQQEERRKKFVAAIVPLKRERDRVVSAIVKMTTLKNGKTSCKRGCKTDVADLRNKLANINTRINMLERQLNKPRLSARAERDMLIRELLNGCEDADVKRMRVMQLNEETVRPRHGYPAPPPRRDDTYPKGGAWGHQQVTCQNVRGEFERLHTYAQRVYEMEKETKRVKNMLEHLMRLNRKLRMLGSEENVRKQGHKYYATVQDARA